ncbi:hypothetical protein Pedsa_0069 [Pseudopedobacter saltans DSM 12145]|uniref:Lipoprotein n=1 Tax=Pseudopedobacter saltans (strain ATCC 51119 / DSM 12145 / JCM 21818 / CCUG 39354 / LMG 10337 / NBRC 100064 / NCIMB 13643) TaxID=762903 RepID=F0SCR8_PSESL|nr:hypothetical protein [Pseudopedobacter saltans]ADY50657.1 hypothetical protein Pedsa_0069 [Pseudopedobacter saltans DSM 12145]
MKNLKKLFVFALFAFASVIMVSCSKDDDPADNDLFVGTYRGSIHFLSSDKEVKNDNGTVRVVKVGNNYNFIFSDGIPDLNGVEFRKDANTVISIGGDASKAITITESNLSIAYTNDKGVWTANCKR